MQGKRMAVLENNLGVAGQIDVELQAPINVHEMLNFHNIWIGATVEPQNAGANCQGSWVLWKRINAQTSITFTDVQRK